MLIEKSNNTRRLNIMIRFTEAVKQYSEEKKASSTKKLNLKTKTTRKKR